MCIRPVAASSSRACGPDAGARLVYTNGRRTALAAAWTRRVFLRWCPACSADPCRRVPSAQVIIHRFIEEGTLWTDRVRRLLWKLPRKKHAW